MKLHSTILSAIFIVAMLFATTAQSAVTDRVSEAGERLRIKSTVRNTVDGVVTANLKQDLKKARRLYEEAIQRDSTYAPARYALAKMLLFSRADSAAIHARQAHLSDTTNRWYLDTYAQSLINTERYDEAVIYYEKLLKVDPRNINAYRILAILYNRKQQHNEALAVLDSAEVRGVRHSYLSSLKRQILISTNQMGRAIVETQAAINDNPYSADSQVAMAELYAQAKIDSLATKHYDAAMRIDSARLETLLSYGDYAERRGDNKKYLDILQIVFKSGDLDTADKISLINEAISNSELYRREYLRIGDLIRTLLLQSPMSRSVIEMQCRHLISMGMAEEAVKFMKSYVNESVADMALFRTIIGIERHLMRTDSVEHYLHMAADKFPEESSFRFERAYTLVEQERYDDAIECYRAEMEGATDSLQSAMLGTIGDVYHQMALKSEAAGDTKSAAKHMKLCYRHYDKALKADEDNIMVLNNYAYFLSERGGNLQRAYDMSKRSTELDVSNPTFLDTYAWILYRMGRYANAKVAMRQAISFDRSENGEIAMHYGEILSVLGESTMAEFYWGKALEWGMSKEAVETSRKRAAIMATHPDKSIAPEAEAETEATTKERSRSKSKSKTRSKGRKSVEKSRSTTNTTE